MSKVFSFIAIFFLGLFIGWGVLLNTTTNENDSGMQFGIGGGPGIEEERSNTQISQAKMQSLFREHGTLAVLHMQAIYDGKDASPTANQLNINSREIAAIIGSTYGAQARTNFATMWQQHINYYEEYAKALKTGDEQKINDAKYKLDALAIEMGDIVHQFSPNISADSVTNYTNEHVMLTLATVEAYASKNQTEYVSLQKSAGDQASRYADYLYKGIQDARPDTTE